jgi:3-oxoacyl-[acyl-carrier protein] reductase
MSPEESGEWTVVVPPEPIARGIGRAAVAAKGDVADEAAMAAVFDRAEAEFGGVDVIVHTAARNVLSLLVDLDLAVLDSLYRTNIRGTFVVDQQAAQRIRSGGAIINLSSPLLQSGLPGFGAYTATKGRGRSADTDPGARTDEPRCDGQRCGAGSNGHRHVPEPAEQSKNSAWRRCHPARAAGSAGRHRRRGRLLAGPDGHWINGQVIRANRGLL